MYLDCRRENPNERRDEHMRGPILIDASVIGNRFPLAQQGADSHVMTRRELTPSNRELTPAVIRGLITLDPR